MGGQPLPGGSDSYAFRRPPTLAAHARRLDAAVTDAARVAAALLATRLARGRLASPFTAREVYRDEWTGPDRAPGRAGRARVPLHYAPRL